MLRTRFRTCAACKPNWRTLGYDRSQSTCRACQWCSCGRASDIIKFGVQLISLNVPGTQPRSLAGAFSSWLRSGRIVKKPPIPRRGEVGASSCFILVGEPLMGREPSRSVSIVLPDCVPIATRGAYSLAVELSQLPLVLWASLYGHFFPARAGQAQCCFAQLPVLGRPRLRSRAVPSISDGPPSRHLEEFAADGYTHVEANCPRCRVIRLRPIDQLPKISLGLTLDALARRCAVPSAVG